MALSSQGLCVAVIDIGKTNKKLCIFDQQLQLLAEVSASFPALEGPHGLLVEDHEGIWAWYQEQLPALYQRHPYSAIAVTTHGATYALLDAQGALAHPIVAYESPLSGDQQRALDQGFYQRFGSLATLQQETGTCDLPLLINPAKSLFYLQQLDTEVLARSACVLNYPQYWGYLLSGERAAEVTYTANHSFLFAVEQRGPSSVAQKLGIADKMPWPLRQPGDRLGLLRPELQTQWGLPEMPIAVGIHDSNAALLPYLLLHPERDFVLNSTGTWCVAMHRVDEARYRPQELEQKVIFNIDALGKLHKTSFLMGGQDYALYHELFGGSDPGFDQQRVDAALAHSGNAILPGAFPSQFPGMYGGACAEHEGTRRTWSLAELQQGMGPEWFKDSTMAHDYLNIALAVQSKVALQRTDMEPGATIFVEGGFRKNPTYLAVLASLLPDNPVVLTDLAQATAGGSAILALALAEGRPLSAYAQALRISEQAVVVPTLTHAASYEAAYLARLK